MNIDFIHQKEQLFFILWENENYFFLGIILPVIVFPAATAVLLDLFFFKGGNIIGYGPTARWAAAAGRGILRHADWTAL